jgi:subtilisin family serine protease
VLSRALIAGVVALATAGPAFAADEFRAEQWGLDVVHAEDAWPTSTGVGALVAVIDTGVQRDHPDLGGRLVDGFDYVGDDVDDPDTDKDPTDLNGHGTHVSGIVVANRDNGEGIAGVAPGARVMPLRVLDENGEGYADDTIKGIDYAIEHGAHVINLSLGDFVPLQSTIFPDRAYKAALERALDAGIVVVLAAGNNGFVKCENPDVADVLCVGAVDRTPMRAGYSSFGSNVDLMAPGGSCLGGSSEDVLSTVIHSDYDAFCGTSQAAPHVAGVAALLVSLGRVQRGCGGCRGCGRGPFTAGWWAGRPGCGQGQLLDQAACEAPRGAPARVPREMRGRPARRVQSPRQAQGASDRAWPR